MSHLSGKTVLVTGAGGSIGSEVARQVLYQKPARLILFDNSELGLFNIDRELATSAAENVVSVLADVSHTWDVDRIFSKYNIDVVFHAAAYKHVTLCEKNPVVAERTNVRGTENVAKIARFRNVPQLVLVSTDKAVRPSCVMGWTKARAEATVLAAGYTVARLGNVLGSSGSVLPLWKEQINKSQPVTITDPNATRYFISSYNAAEFIIDTAELPPGIYVPDMGVPIRLGSLALHHGALNFNVIGLRPGEKKHEELFVGKPVPTDNPAIFRDAA